MVSHNALTFRKQNFALKEGVAKHPTHIAKIYHKSTQWIWDHNK